MKQQLFSHALKIFLIFLSVYLIVYYLVSSELRNDLESLFIKDYKMLSYLPPYLLLLNGEN